MKYPKKLTAKQKKLLDNIEQGNLAEVKKMIQSGCSPNFLTGASIAASPLYVAALMGHYEIARFLIDEGGAEIEERMVSFVTLGMGQLSIGNLIAQRLIKRQQDKV